MPCSRLRIGLTGGIGSGKTTVAQRFASHGIDIIDADQIAHTLTLAGGAAMPAIRRTFGKAYLTDTGALDRAKMRHIVFQDKFSRLQLEAILHPLILTEYEHAAAASESAYLIFVVPLLTELANWRQCVHRVCVVDCPEEIQIMRAMKRSHLSREQVTAIISQQNTRAARLACADDVIINDANVTLARLYEAVDVLHQYYLRIFRTNSLS